MESGCTRHQTRTKGMTRRERVVVVVRLASGKEMLTSKAPTERSTLYALERPLEEALAPFASYKRNLPGELSRSAVRSNKEVNPTTSRLSRSRPGFSRVTIRLFFLPLVPS